ncbi:MAG: VWA domain-containing protein [Magnetococcales bacterium]|nr:VWA domain-containing protein [Magnetococcales bacterium]
MEIVRDYLPKGSALMKMKGIFPLVLVVFVLAGRVGLADDTEIFFGGDWTQGGTVQPNVLFVLDTSSSMNSLDGTTITRLDRMKEALRQILNEISGVNVGLMRFSNPGGPVLFPVAGIDLEVSEIVGAGLSQEANSSQVSIREGADDAEESAAGVMALDETDLEMVTIPPPSSTVQIIVQISNDDDAVEQRANGSMYMDSSDLELIYDGGNQTVGLRFTQVGVPQGATIVSAEIQFEIDESQSGDTDLLIQGEASDDASAFTSATNNVSSRSKTSASVSWNGVPILAVNETLVTPNLNGIVQELVDRAGWSSGNDMVFIITGAGERVVESVSSEGGAAAPKLLITYESGVGGVETDQKVGLRFQNLMVPQGATITSASLGFRSTAAESSAVSLLVRGENVDDSSAFDTALSNITTRGLTSAAVAWNSVPNWDTVGGGYQLGDVKFVVQEIVNRPGWCGGNALSLIVTGTGGPGKRTAASYESNPGLAPVLTVTWDPDSIPVGGGCLVQSVIKQVSASSDDAEESSSGGVDLTSSDLELVEEATTQKIGIRFRSLPIPRGAVIASAELVFEIDEAASGSTSLTIRGEDVDDAITFSSSSSNISNRTTTTASVAWNGVVAPSIDETLTSPDIKSLVQEIVDRPGWVSGNNMAFILTGSGKRVVESYDGETGAAARLRIIYSGGEPSQVTGKTVRSRLIELVDEIQYRSGTPIVDTLYEAARYLRGEGVDYGAVRGDQGSRSEYTRVSHAGSYDGGVLVQPGGCSNDNLDATECRQEEITGSPIYKTPITNSCQENHMVLLSDGAPSVNTAVNRIESLIGAACSGSGSGRCGHELVGYLKETDQSVLEDDQTITTHTIGFNFTSSWMRDMAEVYGGGGFYEADSATDLVSAFRAIFKDILQVDSSFVSPGVAVNQFNRLTHLNDVYFSLFRPKENPEWVGNLKRYELRGSPAVLVGATFDASADPADDAQEHKVVDETTGLFKDTAQSFWSDGVDGNDAALGGAAGELTDGLLSSRNIVTYTGTTDPVDVDLSAAEQGFHENNAALTDSLLDIAGETDPVLAGNYRQNLIQWARGVDLLDGDNDNNTAESRQHIGDPLHSKPVIITYGLNDLTIYFGTNEGVLHGIDVDGGGGREPGAEVLAFIPQEFLKNLKKFYINSGSEAHPYGLDGSIAVWQKDVDNDGTVDPGDGDHVYLYFGMRRGGRGYYALDVTDRDAPVLKWRIDGSVVGDFSELGESWSKPVVTKIKLNGVDKKVLVFAGGYDSNQDSAVTYQADHVGRAVFMVDADTGERVWWASNSEYSDSADLILTEMTNSIPADVKVIDLDLDGYADLFYVGDMGGRIWRFDIDNDDNTGANNLVEAGVIASFGGVAAQLETEAVQITANRRFYNTPDLVLAPCGAGDQLSLAIGSGYRAHPLDTRVQDRFYMIKDSNSAGHYSNLTESNLYDATDNLSAQGTVLERADADAALASANGWLIQLKDSTGYIGEKVLGGSVVFDSWLMFSSYTPIESDTQTCQAQQGVSRFYLMNICNAEPVANLDPAGDENDPSILVVEDRSRTLKRGGIAPEPSVLFPAGSDPVVLVGPEQPISDIPFANLLKRTYWKECTTDALCSSSTP